VARGSDAKRGRRRAWAAAAALALLASSARGETITLRWRHPAPERVVGFRVHIGPAPGEYTRTVDLGRPSPDAEGVFHAQIEVPDGAPVHVAISAYGAGGEESSRSDDWAPTPAAAAPAAPAAPGQPKVVE
jgi:hypothetical protein